MATITNNVWQQIIKVIEDSHGAPRVTPDFSSPEEEIAVKQKSRFEEEIKLRENKKKELEATLKEAQKKQKKMIRNQDKIDDLISELEDVDNNIELESSYLKEAIKMNQIRETIKKTQDLTLELEKYKDLKKWMPNLSEYYKRLKLYTENKANGIENPIDMFDDLENKEPEIKTEAETVKPEENIKPKEKTQAVETKEEEEKENKSIEAKIVQENIAQVKKQILSDIKLPSEQDYNLAKEKISKFIEESYLKRDDKIETAKASVEDSAEEKEDNISSVQLDIPEDMDKEEDIIEEIPVEVKPLEIRKPKTPKDDTENSSDNESGAINRYGQTNPYSDNIFPDMDDINYSDKNISKFKDDYLDDDEDDDDRYSLSASDSQPTQTKKVSEKDMNNNSKAELLEAEKILDGINMQEVIAASKEVVEVSDETKEEIKKAQLRFNIVAKRIFNREVNIDDISEKLNKLDTNLIYKAIVRYKGLSQRQRKLEHDMDKIEPKKSGMGPSFALGVVAFFSMLLGLGCFFIDQVVDIFPEINILTVIYEVIMELPLNNIIAGNVLSGGAFVLIAILLIVAAILGNESSSISEPVIVDEVEIDELKNSIRMARREIVDSLKDFPIPPTYLENPNNNIITVINELREAESNYNELVEESKLPKNENYRALWNLSKKVLSKDELSEDLFDNIAKIRRKIKDYKEEMQEVERKRQQAASYANANTQTSSTTNNFGRPQQPSQNAVESQSSPFGIPSQNAVESQSSPFGIPQPSQNAAESQSRFGIPQPSQNVDNSQSNTFGIPQTYGTEKPENQEMKTASESSSFIMPKSTEYSNEENVEYPTGGGAFNKTEDTSYPTESGAFGSAADTSYPADESAFGTAKDAGYPTEGGIFGTATDTSQSTDEGAFGTAADTGYPTFGAATDGGYQEQLSETQDSNESSDDNDFGIPGIRRYTDGAGTIQPTQSDTFGMANEQGNVNDMSAQSAENIEDNPFGIPGVKRYTNDTPVQSNESTEDNPFGIPGVKRYTNNTPVQPEEGTEDNLYNTQEVQRHADDTFAQPDEGAEDNPFGIPGVKRYTNDTPAQPEESAAGNPYDIPGVNRYTDGNQEEPKTGGLPGLDKFSNRGEQAYKGFEQNTETKKEEDIIPPIMPVGGAVSGAASAATAATAGAGLAGGLPGLDKFSNRGEQAKKEEAENAAAESVEEDPFGIPGIHRYTDTQQADNTDVNTDNEEPLKQDTAEFSDNEPEEIIEPQADYAVEEIKSDTSEEIKIEVKKDKREKEFDEILSILGDDPESAIREVEELTRELHAEIIKRDNAMASLLKLNDAAVRLSTLSSNKWPYKQKAIDASRERIDYLEADKLKLTRHLEMLESKIEEVPYEETPQAISDEIKEVEEQIEQLKLESDKHAIAEELIEKQKLLDMSSSADRSHIIEDTSVYMKELTLGKYVTVKINDDQSGLAICDKDGQWFDTTKDRLSQATREQLYLALRISIADLFDEKSLIFPMFFDEALITWDKRRMKAVMRLLSKMSMHRQVIIFTCHDWLKDMISDYLIGAKIIMM